MSNDDLSLRPGMTGTADIVTVTHDNVLLVCDAYVSHAIDVTTTSLATNGVLAMDRLSRV